MRLKIHENQSRINSTGDEKFELNDVRFEDEGVITCRAENVFDVQETEVELTVLGNFFYLFIYLFFMQNLSFNPRTYTQIHTATVIQGRGKGG